MTELFSPLASTRGNEPALVDERGTTTWAELDERANRIINGLRDAGIEDDATLAVMVGNRREAFEIFVAACHGRWVVVPVNWHWVAAELAYVIANSGASAVIVDDLCLDVAVGAKADPATEACNHWYSIGVDEPPGGVERFEGLVDSASAAEPERQGTGGPMFYTSGTTGKPKGVRSALSTTGLDTAMWSLIGGSFSNMLQLPANGVTLLDGPAYHSAQWVFAMFPLFGGSTIVMRHKFDPAETLRSIDQHGVTNLHLVPTQMVRLLKLDDAARAGFSGATLSIVYHGAAPCPPSVKEAMLDWWGDVVNEYYGGTEGGFLTTISGSDWRERRGSLGRATDLVELRVVDPEGLEVIAGTSGQIYFRSKLGSDFEYHGDPDKTSAAHLGDGWGTLGDVGHVDTDGYLYMSDRQIDMIISGGVNIYPAEIESALIGHPAVNDAAVFGIPDDEMGEQVKAVVELADGFTPGDELAAELMAHCREQLAGYKTPRSIDFTDALPRQPTGKLYKRVLREPYWAGIDRVI